MGANQSRMDLQRRRLSNSSSISSSSSSSLSSSCSVNIVSSPRSRSSGRGTPSDSDDARSIISLGSSVSSIGSSVLLIESDSDYESPLATGSGSHTHISGPEMSPAGRVASRGVAVRGRGRGRPARSRSQPSETVVTATVTSASRSVAAPPAEATPRASFGGSMNFSTFECIVCLESLDTPATIVEAGNNGAEGQAGGAAAEQIDVPGPIANPIRRRGRGGAAAAAARRTTTVLTEIDPREVVATTCGHMYHRYCIQKWFNEQGRKSCPSCRKATTKLLRLFLNIGNEPAQRADSRGVVNNYVSAASGVGVGGGPSNLNPRRAPETGCQNARCVDVLAIHETLVSDYNEIRETYIGVRDDLQLRTAELASMQDSYERARRELDEARSGNGGATGTTGTKRRRQR